MPKAIYTNLTDLTRDKRFTFLSQDIVAAGTTIRIQSIIGFESLNTSSGQVLCIGEIGNEKTEIRRTSANTGPSASYLEITLRDSLQFDHSQDTKVYIVDWDRVEHQWAETVNGTKATIAAYPFNITPDTLEMVRVDTSATAGYFFVRFNNTIESINSDFSDAIPFGGYDDNTVFMIKKRALDQTGEIVDGNIITHEFLNQSLWEARREYHKSLGKRPFRRLFNSDIGNVSTGMYRVFLPTDVEKPHSAENIFGVRIGTNSNMLYYDKKEWDFDFRNKPHAVLDRTYTVGARDIYATSIRDFSTSGVVTIAQTSVEYSAKSNTGGTLRISLDGSYSVDNGADVWQNVSYGLPSKFTVWQEPAGSAFIYFNTPIDTAYVDQNIYSDYYRTLVGYDSDADVLDEPDYNMFSDYLAAKLKHRKNRGITDITTDPDYKLWIFKKQNALAGEYLATQIRIYPDIDHLSMPLN